MCASLRADVLNVEVPVHPLGKLPADCLLGRVSVRERVENQVDSLLSIEILRRNYCRRRARINLQNSGTLAVAEKILYSGEKSIWRFEVREMSGSRKFKQLRVWY